MNRMWTYNIWFDGRICVDILPTNREKRNENKAKENWKKFVGLHLATTSINVHSLEEGQRFLFEFSLFETKKMKIFKFSLFFFKYNYLSWGKQLFFFLFLLLFWFWSVRHNFTLWSTQFDRVNTLRWKINKLGRFEIHMFKALF